MANSVPLIYSGQEEPVLRPIQFFEKDPIEFGKYGREKFYKTLLNLRKNNPALAANAVFRKVSLGDEKAIYAYIRQKGTNRILVILNLSDKEQTISIKEKGLSGKPYNVFMGRREPLGTAPWKLEAWGYAVYVY
jgi:glycosidase